MLKVYAGVYLATVLAVLAGVGCSLEKWATEIRNLQRTEILEAAPAVRREERHHRPVGRPRDRTRDLADPTPTFAGFLQSQDQPEAFLFLWVG